VCQECGVLVGATFMLQPHELLQTLLMFGGMHVGSHLIKTQKGYSLLQIDNDFIKSLFELF
jgi:hypothetical protein